MGGVKTLTMVLDLDTGRFTQRITDATGKMRSLDAQVVRTNDSVNKSHNHFMNTGSAVDAFTTKVWKLQLLLGSVTFLFGGVTGALVKMNAETQRSMALLEGLSKNTNKAAREAEAAGDFQFLQDFAKTAPYSLNTLTDIFVKFKSAGIDPTTGAMRGLVDAVANFGGDNETLKRAAVAIQQMAGKGVVSMEELRQQLGEAVPTAIRIMAESAGMSVQAFVQKVSKGQVLWSQVSDKFFAGLNKAFGGSSQRMMMTFDGQISVMKTNLLQLAMTIGGFQSNGKFAKGGFMDTLTKGAEDFNAWLSNPKTIQAATAFGETLAKLLISTEQFVVFIAKNIGTIKAFGEAFLVFEGVKMANAGFNAFSNTISGVMNVLSGARAGTASQLAAQAAVSQSLETIRGQLYANAEAEAAKATAAREAAVAEVEGIRATIAALKEEEMEYNMTIAKAREARVEAQLAREQAMANAAAGFESTVVGAGNLSGATSVVQTEQNVSRAMSAELDARRKLAGATKELAAAEGALATAAPALVAAQEAETVALAGTTLAAQGLAAGSMLARGALALVGGVPGLIIGGLAAVAYGFWQIYQSEKALDDQSKALHDTILQTDGAYKQQAAQLDANHAALTNAAGATGHLDATTSAATPKVTKFAGEVGEAANQLYTMASAARAAALASNWAAITDYTNKIQKLQTDSDKATTRLRTMSAAMAGAPALGPLMSVWLDHHAAERVTKDTKTIKDAVDARARLLEATRALDHRDRTDFVTADMKAAAEAQAAAMKAANAPVTKPHASHVSPSQRMEGQIDELKSSESALHSLINTMDLGSEAAEKMRGKIEAMRATGKPISAELEAQAIAAASASAKMQKAYNLTTDIMKGNEEASTAAADAMAELENNASGAEHEINNFARKMTNARDQILSLAPSVAANAAEVKKLNDQVRHAVEAKTIEELAKQMKGMKERTLEIGEVSDNVFERVWDGYAKEQRQIERTRQVTMELIKTIQARLALSDNAEDRQKLEESKRLLGELNAYSEAVAKDQVRQNKDQIDQMLRDDRAAVMTEQDQRTVAYEREIEQIMALTDASKLSNEDRLKYESQFLEQRQALLVAANERYKYESASPMQKMVRDYQNTVERMKDLQGSWMEDFYQHLSDGDLRFDKWLEKILADYLMMLIKARTAAMVENMINGITNIFASALGVNTPTLGMNGAQITPEGSFSVPSPIGPGMHSGGIVGMEATFMRPVDHSHFKNAMKYHTGGIAGLMPGEVPTILKKGEGVFTPEQMKALSPADGTGMPKVTVNIINESGTQLDSEQQNQRFDGESMIVDVMVKHMTKTGPVRNAVKMAARS